MPIIPPRVFEKARPPGFDWDEPNYLQYFHYLPVELHDRLLGLTHNANLALAIGSGMWILSRFAPFDGDRQPRDFCSAVWAEMTEEWACDHHLVPHELWHGPVRGPMFTVMAILFDALDERGNNPVIADRSVWMHNFARHVLHPLEPYQHWFDEVVDRLEQVHSWGAESNPQPGLFDNHFPYGDPVSPEALDIDLPYDRTAAPRLVLQFVERERRNGNAFVLERADLEP